MSDLVGNPNCWFSHAKAHLTCTAIVARLYHISAIFKDFPFVFFYNCSLNLILREDTWLSILIQGYNYSERVEK